MDNHAWNFFKAGGAYHAEINSPEDVKNIASLDRKLWSALGCPVDGLVFDPKTLAFLDSDGDGKIRHDEVVFACNWTCGLLKDAASLFDKSGRLKVSNISCATAEGRAISSSASSVASTLGLGSDAALSPADFDDRPKIFASTLFNADGVITRASAADDEECALAIDDIVSVLGGVTDRSGKTGVDAALVEKFFSDAEKITEHRKSLTKEISFLGADTQASYEAFRAVEKKIDDFFLRAAFVRFNPESLGAVNATEEQSRKIFSLAASSDGDAQTALLPVARIEDGSNALPLNAGVNPAWKGALCTFARKVARPVAGVDNVLTEPDWLKIKEAFKPYGGWVQSTPESAVLKLGFARLESLSKSSVRARLCALIERDNAAKPEFDNIVLAEKLVRYNANLVRFLRNFVSFQSFYGAETNSVFQYGSLYIDGRVCELCVKVSDVSAHAATAGASCAYMLYCSVTRKDCAPQNIVAVVSAGDSDSLAVGRNGIFYDSLGRDWNATVVKIVSNPIGVREAFFSPYKRFVKWVSAQIEKRAADADSSVEKRMQSGEVTAADGGGKKRLDIGIVAAIGVAVGGITTAFGMVLNAFVGMGWLMPFGVVGLLLAISLPSMLIAAMKIHSRNLAPILDANGWAVNSKSRINIAFGARLTHTAALPKGAHCRRVGRGGRTCAKMFFALLSAAAVAMVAAWYCGGLQKIGAPAPSWSIFAKKADTSEAKASANTQEPSVPESGTCKIPAK